MVILTPPSPSASLLPPQTHSRLQRIFVLLRGGCGPFRTKTAHHKTSFFPAAVALPTRPGPPPHLDFCPPPHLNDFKGNKGDLIEIFNGTYKQWAVYIGENEVVMLVKKGDQSPGWLESLRVSTGKVKREKLAAVVGNHRCQVNNLLDNKRTACDPSVIVKKAREMVGCNLPYAVFTYNCKDFAIEMRYGEAESGQ
ncbi:unnamed protein product, partial [Pleuronectes platessa]